MNASLAEPATHSGEFGELEIGHEPESHPPMGRWKIEPPTSRSPASDMSCCNLCPMRGLRFDLSIAFAYASHHLLRAD